MSNNDVISEFLNCNRAASANLSSDGQTLYSYGWYEVAKWVDGKVIVRNGGWYSVTTAKQVSRLKRMAVSGSNLVQFAATETPASQGTMNL